MRRSLRSLVMALAVAVAAAPLSATEDGSSPTIDTLTVAVGSSVAVSGKALFASPPETIGTSAELSNPTAVPGLGMDLEAATVTRTSQNQLVFDIAVYDMPPTDTGIPEVVHYDWDFAVHRDGTHLADFTLNAIGSSQYRQPGTLDPSFMLLTCVPDPGGAQDTCTTVGPLNGEFHAGGLRFFVPLSQIQARNGAVLTQTFGGVASSYGASGLTWYTAGDRMGIAPLTVHAPTVSAGIAPAETEDDAVTLSQATVANNGTFTAELPHPGEPGEYKVVVKACLGSDLCGTRTELVTIT